MTGFHYGVMQNVRFTPPPVELYSTQSMMALEKACYLHTFANLTRLSQLEGFLIAK